MRTLKQVKCGETVSVVKLTGEGALKRRIMDMGITKGTEIYVRKVAPLGDPIEVRFAVTSCRCAKARRSASSSTSMYAGVTAGASTVDGQWRECAVFYRNELP